eukprot:1749912-Pleurochrysis_carterae.AAC.2
MTLLYEQVRQSDERHVIAVQEVGNVDFEVAISRPRSSNALNEEGDARPVGIVSERMVFRKCRLEVCKHLHVEASQIAPLRWKRRLAPNAEVLCKQNSVCDHRLGDNLCATHARFSSRDEQELTDGKLAAVGSQHFVRVQQKVPCD